MRASPAGAAASRRFRSREGPVRQALAKIVKGIALGVNSFHAVADLRAASSSSGGPGPWQIRGFLLRRTRFTGHLVGERGDHVMAA
jgi:hypothetical protein